MTIMSWNEVYSTEKTNELCENLARFHLNEAESNYIGVSAEEDETIRKIRSYINNSDFDRLVNFEWKPISGGPLYCYHVSQCLAFYQKREDIDLGISKEESAWIKFKQAEDLCKESNDIFRASHQGRFHFGSDVESVFYSAQRKIADVLGDVPELSELNLRFGPGATTQIIKQEASPRAKLGKTFACSEEFTSNATASMEELQGWIFSDENSDSASVLLEIHPAKLSFVPKTAKTNRAIAVEPSLNTMFQLGIHDYLTTRLKRFGIDLSDQTLNQRLAREGSLTGELATLDLSSASDTISDGLVSSLLPIDWYTFLSTYRTGTVEYKGEQFKLQKFSSMGNGFTFALETLIFFALAKACTESGETVSVYGDDIIIPSHRYALLTKVLRAAGFLPNEKKSFASGPFRESCGKDYYKGIDIRPVFVKNRISGADAFTLHNYYVRSMQPDAATIVLSYLSPEFLLWGPDGYGDGHLIGPHQQHLKRALKERGYCGYTFESYTWCSRKKFLRSPGDHVWPSYSIYASPPREGLPGISREVYLQLPLGNRRNTSKDECQFHYDTCPPATVYRKQRDGTSLMGNTVPGVKGYKRISIYTLNPVLP
uniref:RNA-directed RNA polymerase n=1 Tax=Wenling levi-like virus 4 TaxID=1923500 RepID=A0A1L3KIP0_9VIRU|nr:hypothetical protein [Wenling levi-like virus 4]